MTITLAGKLYAILRQFTETRGIILYEGLYVLVDEVDGRWELSPIPASAEERVVLRDLLGNTLDTTLVTMTKDRHGL